MEDAEPLESETPAPEPARVRPTAGASRRPTVSPLVAVYLLLYLYRSLYSYLGEAVVRGATKLGDSGEFLRAGVLDFSLTALLSSTLATRTLGAIASTLSGGNVVLSHMFFQTLGFIGIVYFMAALAPKDRAWAAILVVLPSFTVWTSIASKEAVVLLGVGLLSGTYLIRLFREDRIPITLPLLLGIYILAVFKLQFLGRSCSSP